MDNLILDLELIKKYSLKEKGKVLIAYSGGLDSHALLHHLANNSDLSVRAIHIHHGLQTVADSWVNHCQTICKALNISLEIVYLNLNPEKGESIEEIAREGRYQALKSSLQAGETLLTAQHQNDQSETLLLQLFRGAGVQGLAAMPKLCDFGKGKHARPLLSVTRQELEAYAKEHQLDFIEDPSNQDTSFDRNFLRKKILPQLRERWLGLDKALSRSASIQAETKQLLDEIAAEGLSHVCACKTNTLHIEKLQLHSMIRQKLILRYWIAKSGFKYPSEKKLQHIFSDVINARDDAQPLVEWQDVQIRRYKKQLFIMPTLSEHDPSQSFNWDGNSALQIDSLDLVLSPKILHKQKQAVTVRFRQGGEKVHSPTRNKTISLKNLLSEAGIPPWQRPRIPLIYADKKLIQIIGLKPK